VGFFDWLSNLFRRKDAVAWATDARERLAKNKLHRALLAAERAVEQRPDDADFLLLRSEILERTDLRERAVEDLLEALEHDSGRAATLLERLEALESSASSPERIWIHAWRVYAERGEYKHARERVARIASRGDAAARALQEQCAGMLAGTGDRRAALFGLAFLAREREDGEEAVRRVLEATGSGGRADLSYAELFIQEMLTDRTEFASALRALVVIRVLLGNEDQAKDLVVSLCRRDAESGVGLLEELRADERRVAAFSLGLMVEMEKATDVPVRLAELLARGLLAEQREDEAARVVLRTVRREPSCGETLLPLAVKLMKSHGGLDALESQARCTAAVGDTASVFLTLHEFVEKDPQRALGVLETLPAGDSGSGEGARISAGGLWAAEVSVPGTPSLTCVRPRRLTPTFPPTRCCSPTSSRRRRMSWVPARSCWISSAAIPTLPTRSPAARTRSSRSPPVRPFSPRAWPPPGRG
jgi:tetratricopeptide (TPR) repeat protein